MTTPALGTVLHALLADDLPLQKGLRLITGTHATIG